MTESDGEVGQKTPQTFSLPKHGIVDLFGSLWYTFYKYFRYIYGWGAMYLVMDYLEKDPDNGFIFRAFVGIVIYALVYMITGMGFFKRYQEHGMAEYEMQASIEIIGRVKEKTDAEA